MKLLSTIFKTLLVPTVFSLSLGVQSTAFAGDSKEYTGSSCAPVTRTADNENWDKYNGRFYAKSNIQVRCPITRDRTINTNGIDYAYVRIYRSPGNVSPACSFNHYDKHGNNLIVDYYSGFPVGNSHRKFDINSSHNRGTYVFRCSLRNGDKVNSYKVREY